MAGIYIHIPFCKQKCSYCNFFSLASSKNKDAFFLALLKEIRLRATYLDDEVIKTIYFGGGTPSLLSKEEINNIIDEISKFHAIDNNAEITLEANPNDITDSYLKGLRTTPVNRLSIGIQSFFDDDLKYLNRIHNNALAESAIKRSQDHGYENLSIDLIYGIPTLSISRWKENIEKTIHFDVPHISAYSLTVEPNTILYHNIKKNKTPFVEEQQSIEQYNMLMGTMKLKGYIHYEISNFCKDGFISRHNSAYWKDEKYLGLGPSAHSYNRESRQWNISNISDYIEKINLSAVPSEMEMLTEKQKYNEYVLTSLRTMWGCNTELVKDRWGAAIYVHCIKQADAHIATGKILRENNILFLTDKGKFFADAIASDMFLP